MQRPLFVLVLALCASIAAGQLAFKRPTQDCLAPALSTFVDVDLFPEPYRIQALSAPQVSADKLSTTIDVASDFTVTYYPTYKVVTNTRKNETYLLYQCGTPNPATAEPGAKVPGLPAAGFKTFQIPLVASAVSDTTVNAFMRQLGVLDRVAFAAQLSVDPCLQKVSGCGNTTADEYNPALTPDQLRAAQTTQAAATDSVWVFDKQPSNPESIAFSATADPGTLARAEWIKFVAPFFNKELEANQIFANISAAYNATKEAAAAEVAAGSKKKVAWVAWSSFAGPGVVVYTTPYKSQYIQDAGGEPLTVAAVNATAGIKPEAFAPTTNFAINYTAEPTADLIDLLKTVDVIIDETYNLTDLAQWKAYFKLPAAGPTGVPAVDANPPQVYSIAGRRGAEVDGSYGNDWFEGAVAHPDVVLADFASVLAPAAAANHQRKYLLRLDGVTEPNITTAAACSLFPACASRGTPEAICPNVYRDCATGTLKQAQPEQRCAAAVVCPDVEATSAPAPAGANQTRNAGWKAAAASSLMCGLGGAAALLLLLAA